jgi:FdrA protein
MTSGGAHRQGEVGQSHSKAVTSLEAALLVRPDVNIALISVPGEYAASEALRALHRGLHVMLFSNSVSLEDELMLKKLASERGLLLMGPDCGTSIIDGTPLGFANVLSRGPVGLVGASGTGLQEVSCLLERSGFGTSQVIGTGSRDLSDDVNGLATFPALRMLDADSETKLIVVVAKEPGTRATEALKKEVSVLHKPCILALLGARSSLQSETVRQVADFDAVVPAAIELLDHPCDNATFWLDDEVLKQLAKEQIARLSEGQEFVVGLFAGGSLAHEAAITLASELELTRPPFLDSKEADEAGEFIGGRHIVVDLGADVFTVGRPHPMIDSTVRSRLTIAAANEPTTAVLLLDVVLGWGSESDPAGSVIAAVAEARELAAVHGRDVAAVVSVCGTDDDPQSLGRSVERLQRAGIAVLPTALQAAKFAGIVARRVVPTGGGIVPMAPRVHKEPRRDKGVLTGPPVVVTLGLSHFADELRRQGADIVAVEWSPVSGGDVDLARKLALIS